MKYQLLRKIGQILKNGINCHIYDHNKTYVS